MAFKIYMPKNGMDMTEGTLIRWLKQEGERVEKGEPIMEIETDKVTMEAEAPESGILLKQLYPEHTVVPVLETVGYIGQAGEELPASDLPAPAVPESEEVSVPGVPASGSSASTSARFVAATPCARQMAKTHHLSLKGISGSGHYGEIRKRDVQAALQHPSAITHLAKSIADYFGMDAVGLTGSGTGGKITKADVLAQQQTACQAQQAAVQTPTAKVHAIEKASNSIPLTNMRKVIAHRMLSSHTEIPPVTQCTKVDVTKLLKLRAQINQGREKADRISINDFVIKAVGKALLKCDRFRMTFEGDHYLLHDQINVGVAVGMDEGLLVPVIRDVDRKSLAEISHESKLLSEKARKGTLTATDTGDGRITISNLGMFGTYCFTPIINQPEASIVGVCSVEDELLLVDGQVEVHQKMMICVTYDHRIINGLESNRFQNVIRDLLQNPIEILL